MNHEEILARAEREIEVKLIRHEQEFQKLRAILVDKYGEEGVRKVEEQIKREHDE